MHVPDASATAGSAAKNASWTGAREGGVDLLARTTLRVDSDLPASALATTVAALQRVPGVLFAEAVESSGRAIVAHDAAVTTASLVAAAEAAGVRARVVTAAPRSMISVDVPLPLRSTLLRILITFVASSSLVFVVASALAPSDTRWWTAALPFACATAVTVELLRIRRGR